MRIADVMRLVRRYGHWMSSAADHDHAYRLKRSQMAMEQAQDILDRIETALKKLPLCTGVSASWCPVHGDCTCVEGSENYHNDDNCPLHSGASNHAEVQE